MKQQLRAGARRIFTWVAPTVTTSLTEVPSLQRDVKELRRQLHSTRERLASLETEVQETRQLNRRVAEVTDLVQEVLLPATDRDEEKFQSALDRYSRNL